ncbi:TonB-dependent receptor [Flavisphingomonas formosensis]|uniref:TonB-dependent receptor n=1 Tax=Flavisphingomonas formosensis TaxID=861534 RepID=UPI001E2F57B5|nr:TonB-dependent receptor [Sphingomonas formosensis]
MRLSDAALLGAGMMMLATSAHAEADVGPVPGEIVVTAQKRAQSLLDVGITITAIGSDDLRRLQATDVGTLANQIPSVVATTSSNLPAFTVRGVGLNEFASNFDSPVAIHIDEVYRSKPYMASMPFYDIARVEALKGPQGTLFGRNTTGGSVNYYTNDPSFTHEAAMNMQIDNYGRARVEGYANTTLSPDLAIRGSYFVAQGTGGPYHNLLTGERFGAPNQIAGRLQVKWRHAGTVIRLLGYGFRDKSDLTPYKSPGLYNADGSFCSNVFNGGLLDHPEACLKFGATNPGTDPLGQREPRSIRDFAADNPWRANNRAYGAYARIEQELGPVTLTSITSFDTFTRDQTEDSDDSVYVTANGNLYSHINQLTQELRATGHFGRFRMLLGGFYEHDSIQTNESNNLSANPLVGLPPFAPRLASAFHQTVRSLAVFTNNEYQLTDQLTLIGGVRYTSDRTAVDGSTFLGANDPQGKNHAITPVIPVDAIDSHRTDGTTSFRAAINWKPSRDQLFYASVSRGFRSGGYSVPFGGTITTFAPEKLTAYEIGSKSRLLDRKLDLNASLFFYDYKDIQITVNDPLSPLVAITRNVGGSRTYGAETELTWRPDPTTTVRLGGTYLDAKFRNTDAVIQTYNGLIPLDGKRPINAPKWSAQGFIQKSFPISDDLSIIANTDLRYVGRRFLQPTNQSFDTAPAYWLQNARLALASEKGRWEVAVWGRNIFNKNYLTYINNVSFFRIEIYGEPVSYGLSASFKF